MFREVEAEVTLTSDDDLEVVEKAKVKSNGKRNEDIEENSDREESEDVGENLDREEIEGSEESEGIPLRRTTARRIRKNWVSIDPEQSEGSEEFEGIPMRRTTLTRKRMFGEDLDREQSEANEDIAESIDIKMVNVETSMTSVADHIRALSNELNTFKAEKTAEELKLKEEISSLESVHSAHVISAEARFKYMQTKLISKCAKKREWKQRVISIDEEWKVRFQIHVEAQRKKLTEEKEILKKRLEVEEEKSLCQICLLRRKDALIFPCHHMHSCYECLDEVFTSKTKSRPNDRLCPFCRSPVSDFVRCHT